MKTTITKQELNAGLSFLSGVPRKSSVPIAKNALIRKSCGKVCFIATDFDTQSTSVINSDQGDDFAFTADYERLCKVVSNLPDDSNVTIDIEENKITLKSGRSKFAVQTLPARDFPLFDSGKSKNSITLKQEDFKRMLQGVSKSMATKDVRYQLNGVFFEVKDNVLSLVASNGFSLAHDTIDVDIEDCEYIIPAANVSRLIKMLGNGDLKITFCEKRIKFEIDGNEIITNIIDAKYPNYRRVLPQGLKHSIEIDKNQFITSCNRAAISAQEKIRAIRIGFSNQMVFTGASGIEQSSDDFDIDYGGDPFEIGFNVDYLINAASPIDAEKITLRFENNMRPVVFESGTYKCVVMPMRM